ncbi:hypothetical protein EMIHUDRAFT_234192 [Emiliania huxleyi CCMP1516]|uniref:non-specific serine/threonine protein kinase n=2 Tax=Emiliania huxleyi TaxID=2903 RepID=A0A0D3K011_EMIH1|nr:hypothetical protein EMIHUDRAFT_234192 [Emiliania huxleyi CCMP1516]EOD29096.1 hypothetical protein EMIHUDRAFT_234192 [Emiliania huxleyi CCMP1516]|eukprot:XP_005781525.1 hypothetical protein EMIHUDRAFT_234192 [Emiliania huxleyi CCMP1516]
MAEGGHATIYEARDTGSGARLAVKRVLVPEERAAAAARELEIHRSLRHDNLLALLGDSHERRESPATQRRKDGTEEFLALLPFAGGGHLWECVASAPKGPVGRRGRMELEEWVGAHTTPMYRAPELCDLHNGLRLGPPADVWALGCLLFTLCFGAKPHCNTSFLAPVINQ